MAVQIDGSQGKVIATSGDYSGGVSIGGTLTYEDVTNIDAVGLITARNGIEIGARPGVAASISVDGNMIVSGISTLQATSVTSLDVSAGLGIAESLFHLGDTNTRVAFPAADTIALDTGGSERVRYASGKTFIHATGATSANDTSTRLSNGKTLNIHGTSSVDGISVVRYSGTYGAYGINIGKSNSGTFGTNTIVADGQELGHVSFYGADGTNFEMAAQITALVNGTPSDGSDMPGALSFRTTAEGSASVTERLRIDAKGNMGLGVTPSANWVASTDFRALQIGSGLVLYGRGSSDEDRGGLTVNAYHTGSAWKYLANGNASNVYLNDGNTDIQYASANSSGADAGLSWSTAFRSTAGGQVCIGNYFTSQEIGDYTASLQVGGTTANSACISINRWQNTADGACLQFFKGRGSSGGAVDKGQNGDVLGSITWNQANNNNLDGQGNTARIDCNIDDDPGGGDYPGRLSFWTCPNASTTLAERMRINNAGDVMINATASTDGNTQKGLHIYADGGSMASFKRAQSGAGLRFIHVNTLSGWIEFNSNNTVSYTSASDYRLKENNVPISDGIARVKNLKPYRFNWKAEPDKTVDGFFAHEAQEVVPESATRSKDRVVTQEDLLTGYVKAPMKVGDPIHQSMDNAKLIPLLTAALKEAISKIETLESEVAALKFLS